MLLREERDMDIFIYLFLGIIAGVIIAWFFYELKIKEKRIKRVDAIIKDIISLNSYTKKILLDDSVKTEERKSRIILNEIIVANSGTLSVKNQEMVVKFAKNTKLIDCKVTRKPAVGFDKINHNKIEKNLMIIKFDNLNPKDNVNIRITTLDNSNGDFTIYLRGEEVETRIFDYHTEIKALSEFFAGSGSKITFWNVLFSLPKLLKLVNMLKKYRIA